jgi:hypothetical protein
MTPAAIEARLLPGDVLLYKPTGIFGTLIRIKSWHEISHCEMYVGDSKSVASRDGIGVNVYPWRNTQLVYVLRPTYPLDWASFWRWFLTVKGEKYDWWGLHRFLIASSPSSGDNDKMFCSEFLTRAYRYLNAHVFSDYEDADAIAPFQFLTSPNLTPVLTPTSLA